MRKSVAIDYSVGTVTTGAAGSSAQVSNVGTTTNAIWDYTIPRGDVGATGPTGPGAAAQSAGMSITQAQSLNKPITTQSNGNFWGQDILRYTTAAISDRWVIPFSIGAGTFDLYVMGGKVNNSGIWTFRIDGAGPIQDVDMYDAGTSNCFENAGPFTFATAGEYELHMDCNSKNPSSSSYHGYFNSFVFKNPTFL